MNNILMATILDIILGDPYSFPHPVKLMGKIISLEEKVARKIISSNKGLKFAGLIIVLTNILLGFFLPFYLLKLIKDYKVVYFIINTYLIYTCIAARSLHFEAIKVLQALDMGLEEGRKRLSYIVGRDTSQLTEEEILKATVETVAENTSDGVIAPLLYIFLLGAPGGMVYKFVNTMDSMLGYMNKKYIDLGYFPAIIDDIFNYIPARVTGILMNLSSFLRFNTSNGFKIMFRDRKNHKSPNAAYPEGAVAGLLEIELGGNNLYNGVIVKKPTIGDKIKEISKQDIKSTINIMYSSELLLLVLYLVIMIMR